MPSSMEIADTRDLTASMLRSSLCYKWTCPILISILDGVLYARERATEADHIRQSVTTCLKLQFG